MESSIYPSLPVEMHALGAGFYRTAAANALDVQEDPDEGNAALTLSGQELYDAAKDGNCGAVEAALQMGDSDFLGWVDEVSAAMHNRGGGYTPLLWAVFHNNLRMTRLLLWTESREIDTVDKEGYSPLMWAVMNRSEVMVKLLLQSGAQSHNCDILDEASRGFLDACNSLLLEGIAKSCAKLLKLSETSCYCGESHCGKADAVLQLLEALRPETYLVVNWQDQEDGRTPLMHFVTTGCRGAVKHLLGAGAVTSTADKVRAGFTAAYYAALHQDDPLLLLLHQAELSEAGMNVVTFSAKNTPLVAGKLAELAASPLAGEECVKQALAGALGSALINSSRNGALVSVSMLLDAGAGIESRRVSRYMHGSIESGKTPFTWAARWGHTACCELLLRHGATVDVYDWYGQTALWWAIFNKHQDVICFLLKNGAAAEYTNNKGETPLICAADWGNVLVIKMLLVAGAKTGTRKKAYKHPEERKNALQIAQDRGHTALYQLLQPMPDGHATMTLLFEAVRDESEGNLDTLRHLLEVWKFPVCIKQNCRSLLITAVEMCSVEKCQLLVDLNAHLESRDINGDTALEIAVSHVCGGRSGFEPIAKLLSKAGALATSLDMPGMACLKLLDPSALLFEASTSGREDGTAQESSPDTQELHAAATNGDDALLREVTPGDPRLESLDGHGNTPLLLAARYGHVYGCLWTLIRRAANTDVMDENGTTPLMWAAYRGDCSMASMLLSSALDPHVVCDAGDKSGHTALYWATLEGHEDVADILRMNGATTRETTPWPPPTPPVGVTVATPSAAATAQSSHLNATTHSTPTTSTTPTSTTTSASTKITADSTPPAAAAAAPTPTTSASTKITVNSTPPAVAAAAPTRTTSSRKTHTNPFAAVFRSATAGSRSSSTTTTTTRTNITGDTATLPAAAATGALTSRNLRALAAAAAAAREDLGFASSGSVSGAGTPTQANSAIPSLARVSIGASSTGSGAAQRSGDGGRRSAGGRDENVAQHVSTTAEPPSHPPQSFPAWREFEGCPLREALHTAVADNNPRRVEQILKSGAEIDAPDTEGRTALWHAISRGESDMIRLLMKHNAKHEKADGKQVRELTGCGGTSPQGPSRGCVFQAPGT
ncbi:MAG: hypothetical protein WDW38_010607 [Sanguina aurantia]